MNTQILTIKLHLKINKTSYDSIDTAVPQTKQPTNQIGMYKNVSILDLEVWMILEVRIKNFLDLSQLLVQLWVASTQYNRNFLKS